MQEMNPVKEKYPLSIIIPTLNEEKILAQCLDHCLFADEIIVIDSLSNDSTTSIAKSYGAKVIERAFDNFSSQKNYALQYAKNDWVLFLDADEILSRELVDEIKKIVVDNKSNVVAYDLLFKHCQVNQFPKYSLQGSDYVTRLIHKKFCSYSNLLVHEKILVNGQKKRLRNPVWHFTYKSMAHYIQKRNQYAWFQARQKYTNRMPGWFKLIIKPWFRFSNDHFMRLGFLDGIPSYAFNMADAYGVFSRYVKMYLLSPDSNPVKNVFQDYDSYVENMRKQAIVSAKQMHVKGIRPSRISYYTLPLIVLCKEWLLQSRSQPVLVAYMIAWLKAFQEALALTYYWIQKQGLDED